VLRAHIWVDCNQLRAGATGSGCKYDQLRVDCDQDGVQKSQLCAYLCADQRESGFKRARSVQVQAGVRAPAALASWSGCACCSCMLKPSCDVCPLHSQAV